MDNLKWLAVREFCQSCTIPVIGENETRSEIIGSALLFEINNRKYLITAYHVAKHIMDFPNNCGIPVAKQKAECLTFINCEVHFPKASFEQKLHDVAVIELTNNTILCDKLIRSYQFISLEFVGRYHDSPANYLLAGYPIAKSNNITNRNILGDMFLLITPNYEGSINLEDVPEPEHSVFLDYGKTIIDDNGNEVAAPELEGISGGTIWNLRTDYATSPERQIWTVKNNLELIAVEVSYLPQTFKYIRGVKWHVVAHAFSEVDPKAKDMILERLARSA